VHRVTPIIVLTGLRDPDRIREVCSLGANACLEKPMGYEELANLVDATLSFWGLTSLLTVLHGSHSEPFTIDNLPPRAVQRVAGTR
jgi:DNA-binding response OmpR family regulator